MYYADLTPYRYDLFGNDADAFNIGWLDNEHIYSQGIVSKQFLDGLFFLCKFHITTILTDQEKVKQALK